MAEDIYTADERRLLGTWLSGESISPADQGLLAEWGFDHNPCSAYTRLDAWAGSFAVRDIQARLPNCGQHGRLRLLRLRARRGWLQRGLARGRQADPRG